MDNFLDLEQYNSRQRCNLWLFTHMFRDMTMSQLLLLHHEVTHMEVQTPSLTELGRITVYFKNKQSETHAFYLQDIEKVHLLRKELESTNEV